MACDFMIPKGMTQPQRKKQIADTIARLEEAIKKGTVQVRVGANGAIAFAGWQERNQVADSCAYRKLLASGSPAFRAALVKAEAVAGRKVDEKTIAAGVHSHDGGKSWDPGHK